MDKFKVASTILEQLSPGKVGNAPGRLKAMMGASRFFAVDPNGDMGPGVTFVFKGCTGRRYNVAKIVLMSDDTYTMELSKVSISAGKARTWRMGGLYAEDLQGNFKTMTGLDTTLGNIYV